MTNQQTQTDVKELQFKVQERAIIYARVSTDEQAESGTSIDNQVEKSLAYAQANNIKVVATFKEDYTGKVLDRPELNKVREMLCNGQADNLIVYKPNRLDRSEWGVNLLVLMQQLKQLGVGLHYSQDNRKVDLHNPMEVLVYGSVGGWQAGEDHRETVTKLHEGRIRRAKDGYVVPHGKAPFGYRTYKGDDKKWYFEIVESEAKIVRLIFQWYVFGDETGEVLSYGKIADKLNKMGIRAKKGGHWRRAGIGFIVSNETYAGTWHYGKRESRNKRKPTSQSIAVTVPAIVDREVWKAAQKRIKENKQNAKRNRRDNRYLFASRCKCGVCDYAMLGVTKHAHNKKYPRYICRNRHMNKRERYCECDNAVFDVDIVDARLWQWIEEIAQDEEKLREGLLGYQGRQESKVEPIRRELKYTQELIEEKTQELDEEMENLDILTSRRAKARKAFEIDQIESVLDGLEVKKTELLEQLETKSITEEQIMGIIAFMAQVAEDLETLREAERKGEDRPELKKAVFEAKRKLLAMLDVQVVLFVENGRRTGKITAKMCPDGDTVSLEDGSTCIAKLNRQHWLTITGIIDLE